MLLAPRHRPSGDNITCHRFYHLKAPTNFSLHHADHCFAPNSSSVELKPGILANPILLDHAAEPIFPIKPPLLLSSRRPTLPNPSHTRAFYFSLSSVTSGPFTDSLVQACQTMKLLSLNFLTCAVKACKSSPASFPLHFKDVELEQVEMEYNPQFIRNIMPRVEWEALRQMCQEVSRRIELLRTESVERRRWRVTANAV